MGRMYLDEQQLLHISIVELKMRNYELKDLLSDNLDSIARQVVYQFNLENNINNLSGYQFEKIYGLIEGQLIIKVGG